MKGRSPNYPSVGLGAAIRGAQKIWSEEKRSAFPSAVAVRHLGFNSMNGTSRGHLAALKQYGLIKEGENQNFSLTPLAIKIMAHPEGSPERLLAIREAALAPKLFKDLYQSHREASDATIRAHLITNRSFGDDGAKKAIRSFRETTKLSGLDELHGNVLAESEDTAPENQVATAANLRGPSKQELSRAFASKTEADLAALGIPVPGAGQQLRFSISRDSEAQIIFTGAVTQEAIEKLTALLELQKDTFPTAAELEKGGGEGE